MLTVANGEMVCSDDPAIGQGWTLPSNPKTKDGYLYFVLPPGKWVRTVDEILDEWYRNPNVIFSRISQNKGLQTKPLISHVDLR